MERKTGGQPAGGGPGDCGSWVLAKEHGLCPGRYREMLITRLDQTGQHSSEEFLPAAVMSRTRCQECDRAHPPHPSTLPKQGQAGAAGPWAWAVGSPGSQHWALCSSVPDLFLAGGGRQPGGARCPLAFVPEEDEQRLGRSLALASWLGFLRVYQLAALLPPAPSDSPCVLWACAPLQSFGRNFFFFDTRLVFQRALNFYHLTVTFCEIRK